MRDDNGQAQQDQSELYREAVAAKFDAGQLESEYANWLCRQGLGICNGDDLLRYMEQRYMADEFIDEQAGVK